MSINLLFSNPNVPMTPMNMNTWNSIAGGGGNITSLTGGNGITLNPSVITSTGSINISNYVKSTTVVTFTFGSTTTFNSTLSYYQYANIFYATLDFTGNTSVACDSNSVATTNTTPLSSYLALGNTNTTFGSLLIYNTTDSTIEMISMYVTSTGAIVLNNPSGFLSGKSYNFTLFSNSTSGSYIV